MTVKGLSSILYSILSSKLSTYGNRQAITSMVGQLAQVFIMSDGRIGSYSIDYLRRVDTEFKVELHSGMSRLVYCGIFCISRRFCQLSSIV